MYTKVANKGFLVIRRAHYKDIVRNMIKGAMFPAHNYQVFYDLNTWFTYARNQKDLKNRVIRTKNFKFYVPTTVMCPNIKLPRFKPDCNRLHLYIRDKGICGYCGTKLKYKDATKDHIYPSSKGGKNVWSNIVLACKICNNKKANNQLHSINMKINHARVYVPTWYDLLSSDTGNLLSLK